MDNQLMTIPKEYGEYLIWLVPMREQLIGQWAYVQQTLNNGQNMNFSFMRTQKVFIDCVLPIINNANLNDVCKIELRDVLDNNPGYIKLKNAFDLLDLELRRIGDLVRDQLERRKEAIVSNAQSQVTGPGFGIVTNSLASIISYSIVSTVATGMQESKAYSQMNASLTSAYNTSNRSKAQMERAYEIQTFVPTAIAASTDFVDYFVKYYIKEAQRQQPDFGVNFDKSEIYLQSLANSYDGEEQKVLLRQAFEMCPYNPDVYMESIMHEIAFPGIIGYARNFGLDGVLAHCMDIKYAQSNDNKARVQWLKNASAGHDDNMALINVWCGHDCIDALNRQFKRLYEMMDGKNVKGFARLFMRDYWEVYLRDDRDMLKNDVKEHIEGMVIDNSLYYFVINGLVWPQDIPEIKSKKDKWDDVYVEITDGLMGMMKPYLDEWKAVYAGISEKENGIDNKEKEIRAKYGRTIEDVDAKIHENRIVINAVRKEFLGKYKVRKFQAKEKELTDNRQNAMYEMNRELQAMEPDRKEIKEEKERLKERIFN